jgi:hypothetical protein
LSPFYMVALPWVASDKTLCKPFDLLEPEQWVFGQTL